MFYWRTFLLLIVFVVNFVFINQSFSSSDVLTSNFPQGEKKQIQELFSEDNVKRVRALRKISEMGENAIPVIPTIIDLLDENTFVLLENDDKLNETTSIEKEAKLALVKIGKPAVNPLIKALKDEDVLIRRNAAEVLGLIGSVSAVEPLIAILKDTDDNVREKVAESLGKIKDKRAIYPLIETLSDNNPNVRKSAAFALGELGDPKAIDPLISLLRDKNRK